MVTDEILEDLLNNTVLKGNNNLFLNKFLKLSVSPMELKNMEPFADAKIGEYLSEIKSSKNPRDTVTKLEDYLRNISKNKTFSEVGNMVRLEGDAITNNNAEQINKFVMPMADMEQKINDIVKDAIRAEIAQKDQNSISSFSDEGDAESSQNQICPKCNKEPCECQQGDVDPNQQMPMEGDEGKDGSSIPAGVGITPEATMPQEPSTKLEKDVEDLQKGFSKLTNILAKVTNFNEGTKPFMEGMKAANRDSKEMEGFKDNSGKEPDAFKDRADSLAQRFGYQPESEEYQEFINGYLDTAGVAVEASKGEEGSKSESEESQQHSDLYYSEDYDAFLSDEGELFTYSEDCDGYLNENGEILLCSEDDSTYYSESVEEYFSNINEEGDDMEGVKIYFSDEDQCFFSEFGEVLDYDEAHNCYISENGSVYFSDNGPYADDSEDMNYSDDSEYADEYFDDEEGTEEEYYSDEECYDDNEYNYSDYDDYVEEDDMNFSSIEEVMLFSESDVKLVTHSEIDEDGDLICWSDDGTVLVYDNENGCYFSGDGDIYFDEEGLETAEEPVHPAITDEMGAADDGLVMQNNDVKAQMDSQMVDRVNTNADGVPSGFAPAPTPMPSSEVTGEGSTTNSPMGGVKPQDPAKATGSEPKAFSCITFSEVPGSMDQVSDRYQSLKQMFSEN